MFAAVITAVIKSFILLVITLGANIFVSSGGVLKLGDFGSSIKLKNPLQTVYGEICNIRGTVGEIVIGYFIYIHIMLLGSFWVQFLYIN